MKKNHKKILKAGVRILVIILALELCLNVLAYLNISMQNNRNVVGAKDDGTYRILAIGDSFTYGKEYPWPSQLETILNNITEDKKYKVCGSGLPGGNSEKAVSLLDYYINICNPDMVIVMIGINDPEPTKKMDLLQKSKIYNLFRFLAKKTYQRMGRMSFFGSPEKRFIKKGIKYQKEENYKAAEKELIKARDINPNDPDVYHALFDLYSEMVNPEGAEEVLIALFDIEPYNHKVYQDLIDYYILTYNTKRLEELSMEILVRDPEYYPAQELSAFFASKRKEYDKAAEIMKKIVEKNPGYTGGMIKLYVIYTAEGDDEKAGQMLENARKSLSEEEIEPAIAETFYAYHLYDNAEKVMEHSGFLSEAQKTKIRVSRFLYNNTDFSEENINLLREYLKENPEDIEYYGWLLLQYRKSNLTEDDLTLIENGALFFPGNIDYFTMLRKYYVRHDDFDAGKTKFEQLIAYDPANKFPYHEMGRLYHEFGKNDEFISYLESMIYGLKENKDDPLLWDLYVCLGKHYALGNRDGDLNNLLAHIRKTNPKIEIELLRELVTAYDEMGDKNKKEDTAKKIQAIKKENMNAATSKNFKEIESRLKEKGIRFVAMQYPLMDVDDLKTMLEDENTIFISNEDVFREGLKRYPYESLFIDRDIGTFGHCTALGNRMIAENAAEVILKAVG